MIQQTNYLEQNFKRLTDESTYCVNGGFYNVYELFQSSLSSKISR